MVYVSLEDEKFYFIFAFWEEGSNWSCINVKKKSQLLNNDDDNNNNNCWKMSNAIVKKEGDFTENCKWHDVAVCSWQDKKWW